jgi:phage gp16-like protein
METGKQRQAARKNIKRAQRAARQQKTITKLPKSTRSGLSHEAANSRQRSRKAGRALEHRNRTQLYERAKKLGIEGRSKMGKWGLIDAIRRKGG